MSEEERLTEGMSSAGPSAALEPIFVHVEGSEFASAVRVAAGTIVIGSERTCDVVVDDSTVSRRHLSAELLPGGVRVRDLESRNGTRYRGARVKDVRVPIGGSIDAGRATLRFLRAAGGNERAGDFHGLIGRSAAMLRLFGAIDRLAAAETSVVIRGETGVGKGAVASVLHELGPGPDRPFVVFDCAAVHPEIMQSELFGHVKGAFTGAAEDRPGAVGRASGGTLFLDEIGELPLALQSMLLRIVETRRYVPVGGGRPRRADFRFVAATHRDLERLVRERAFREDLYHRLVVTEVEVPPLSRRVEDIPALAQSFARSFDPTVKELGPEVVAQLQSALWPGNVRELRNAVERLMVLPREDEALDRDAPFAEVRDQVLGRFEREYLSALLRRHKGNASAAARATGMSRAHFYRLLQRSGLLDSQD